MICSEILARINLFLASKVVSNLLKTLFFILRTDEGPNKDQYVTLISNEFEKINRYPCLNFKDAEQVQWTDGSGYHLLLGLGVL